MTGETKTQRVVVVGGGFGGIEAVKRLQRASVEVTLVDRRNFHLFQPLTYQVATGALTPGEIAYPLRALFKRARNVRVLMAEVIGFDLDSRHVLLAPAGDGRTAETLPYDTLIVAAGSRYSYFGHDGWSSIAPEVKSLESALATRGRILKAFESAEWTSNPATRAEMLSFVVVGAGPTGVEMAGQIAELARDTLRRDFRAINSIETQVALIEAADRPLPNFPPVLSAKAARSLQELGVTVRLNRTVIGVDRHGVTIRSPDGSTERVAARTVIWAAGVEASALAGELARQSGAELDSAGRLTVDSDLSISGHPEVIALGDMVRVRTATGEMQTLPGVAPVAIQQGRYAGRLVADRLRGRAGRPFRYRDKGNLATIGRARAVADLRLIRMTGLLAWLVWLLIHLWYLIGFQNRVLVMTRWAFSFITRGRGARLITDPGRAWPGGSEVHAAGVES